MGDTKPDLKVPKSRVSVELALHGGETREVELFLAEHEAHAFRQQSVADLLEEDRAFLPAFAVDEAALVLFHRSSVAWLSMVGTAGDDQDELELFEEDHPVEIKMRDGATLVGELLYSPPAGRARIVDHLNDDDRFVRLYAENRVYFVNKAFVLWVRERGEAGHGE